MKGLRVAARLSLAILFAIGLQAGGSEAHADHPQTWSPYHWPVRPFDSQHPLQGIFGDPRTVYPLQPFGRTGPNRKGTHSFHNGVDISAKAGTPVYPVVSGRVVVAIPDEIVVHTDDGRSFQYYHLDRAVHSDQIVVAQRTILGRVKAKYLHVHLAEIDGCLVHNPLAPGHLIPYRDPTKPAAVGIYIDNGGGPRPLAAAHLRARDTLVVAATDPPAQPLLDPYSSPPQIPALIEWRLFHGGTHTAWKVSVDFPPDPTSTARLLAHLRPRHLPEQSRLRTPALLRDSRPLPVPPRTRRDSPPQRLLPTPSPDHRLRP